MKKTLLEYHYQLRIESLKDDATINFAERFLAVERLAKEHGWRHVCDQECIDIMAQ
jgi:hypothetical protein